jgi:uncharacterized repeat protein (TIGR03803 family)
MEPRRKTLLLGCALAIAGCAQNGLNLTPAPAGNNAASVSQRTGSGGPEIYVFQGPPDAATPLVGLVGVGNTLYGTTTQGGANNMGAVYSVSTAGVESVMHSFSGGADGINPEAPLTNVNGTLYGTTSQQGTQHGTIFSIAPSGSYHVVYNFGTKTGDCLEPDTAMIYVPAKSALYGVAYDGGANGEGCIFKLSLKGNQPKESVLYSFTGLASSSTEASAPVLYKDALYLTTPGGGAKGHGAILKVTLSGKKRLLYSFKGDPDGAEPMAGLVVLGDALYGTTYEGGQGACVGYGGCGTVFKVTPSGKESILYRFTDVVSKVDGTGPQAPLINVGGTLYGTTPNCSGNGCGAGTVFSMTPSGHERIVYDFTLTSSSPPGSPEFPYAPVTSFKGTLYGTTDNSAKTGYGTVYAAPQ